MVTHCVEGPFTRDPLLTHRLPAVTAVCRGFGYWERWMWADAARRQLSGVQPCTTLDGAACLGQDAPIGLDPA